MLSKTTPEFYAPPTPSVRSVFDSDLAHALLCTVCTLLVRLMRLTARSLIHFGALLEAGAEIIVQRDLNRSGAAAGQ